MSLYLRVIQASELDEILDYENRKLSEMIADETERMLASWNTRWRKESLQHYLSMGWSFLARDTAQPSTFCEEGLLVGYFIAQPLLFFDGQTQSLWIEHLQYSSLQARDELAELAYKLSREKHFQKVFFPGSPSVMSAIRGMKAETWSPQAFAVKTTKVNS
jgi:hypothetical protein